ncbi:hypothetical protein L596_007531 [Steinernema carpocapsae]|uniref:Kinesin-like protein n=1 Tax=Steinernema carpocapsae TaxID=34508 RepID=A0A4U5PA86_STECR|nr:hypothetical protein L596_007531 [Steinernema carpocapsae]
MLELIKVATRVRPALSEDDSIAVTAEERNRRICVDNGKSHIYDAVYGADSDQVTIFEDMVKPIIDGCVAGYNGTVFVYGQTGSGKTYTMLGADTEDSELDVERRGLIPRSMEHLFQILHGEREKKGASFKVVCQCSFVELYNEELYDLLDDKKSDGKLRLRQAETVIIDGAKEETVHSCNDAVDVLMQGWKNRKVAETAMNRESSRSHAIFIVSLKTDFERNGTINRKRSRINLVDLAGSERQEHTKTSGTRLKEAASINKSLMVLTRVIERLSANTVKKEHAHVPYRDSKLTHLLSDSLGGNARTAVIVNVHPGLRFRTQSVATLQFADNVKCIENVATVNEDVTTATEKKLIHDQIEGLQREMKEQGANYAVLRQKLQEENSALAAEKKLMQDQIEGLQREMEEQGANYAVLRQKLQEENSALAAEKKLIHDQIEGLQREMKEQGANYAVLRQKLQEENSALAAEKKLMQDQIEGLQREMKEQGANYAVLRQKLQEENSALAAEKKLMQDQIEGLQREMKEQGANYAVLRQKLQEENSALAAEKKLMQDQIEGLQREMKEQGANYAVLRQKLQEENSALAAEKKLMQDQIEGLQREMKEQGANYAVLRQKLQEENSALAAEKKLMQDQIEGLQREMKEQGANYAVLRQKLQEENSVLASHANRAQKIRYVQQLSDRNAKLEAEVAKMRAEKNNRAYMCVIKK